jgi:hypothetical protein
MRLSDCSTRTIKEQATELLLVYSALYPEGSRLVVARLINTHGSLPNRTLERTVLVAVGLPGTLPLKFILNAYVKFKLTQIVLSSARLLLKSTRPNSSSATVGFRPPHPGWTPRATFSLLPPRYLPYHTVQSPPELRAGAPERNSYINAGHEALTYGRIRLS